MLTEEQRREARRMSNRPQPLYLTPYPVIDASAPMEEDKMTNVPIYTLGGLKIPPLEPPVVDASAPMEEAKFEGTVSKDIVKSLGFLFPTV